MAEVGSERDHIDNDGYVALEYLYSIPTVRTLSSTMLP